MMQVRGTAKHIILPRIITLQNSKPSKTLPRAGLSLCRPDRQDPISISIIITPPMETMGRRIWAPADKNRQPIMLHAHNPSVSPVCPAPAPRPLYHSLFKHKLSRYYKRIYVCTLTINSLWFGIYNDKIYMHIIYNICVYTPRLIKVYWVAILRYKQGKLLNLLI